MAVSPPATVPHTPVPQTARADVLQLSAGQVVEARVLGSGSAGTTQLALGNQIVDAALQVKLQEGTLIRLLVQQTVPALRLTVLPQLQAPTPQTGNSVQANPGNGLANQFANPGSAPSGATSSVPTGSASTATPSNSAPVQTGQNAPSASPTANAGAARAPVPVPAPANGASATTNTAQVTQGQSTTPQSLPAGTTFQVQTSGNGAQARPVLVPVAGSSSSAGASGGPAQPSQPTPQGQANPVATVPPIQQAVIQTAQGAVARQDSISALLVSLAGLGSKLSQLPKPVAQAGNNLLASQLRLDGKPLDGAALKQAILRSGVFQESALGKGGVPAQGDIKSSLLKLAGALRGWLGQGTAGESKGQSRLPPPLGGATPRSERPVLNLPFADLPPREAGARLLAQVDAALARIRLTQISSLPDSFARTGPTAAASPELNFELPLLLSGELSVGQFQILRDGANQSGADADQAWKMRFSINFSQTGEVGATVSWRRQRVGVMLWAEREDVASALSEMVDDLEQALDARGLEPGSLRVRHGSPPNSNPPAGFFMDDKT